ncbi:hypothetical protein [Pseudomonas amygdali]|uniref:hypothetical protein n=1 Tax=Pseudomonas amygdali TaxID=47877 RepID=UPI00160542C9|nr:hypothetical protein [Pseudomonas amygdali]
MNKNDYKALLISIIAGIVAGLAVNITWSHLGSAPDSLPTYPMPKAQWVLQLPPGLPAALPLHLLAVDPPSNHRSSA